MHDCVSRGSPPADGWNVHVSRGPCERDSLGLQVHTQGANFSFWTQTLSVEDRREGEFNKEKEVNLNVGCYFEWFIYIFIKKQLHEERLHMQGSLVS